MKKLVFALLLVLGYACSQDNSDLPNDPNHEPSNPLPEGKLLKKLIIEDSDNAQYYGDESYIFYYSGNKLDSIVEEHIDAVAHFNYSGNKIEKIFYKYSSSNVEFSREYLYDEYDRIVAIKENWNGVRNDRVFFYKSDLLIEMEIIKSSGFYVEKHQITFDSYGNIISLIGMDTGNTKTYHYEKNVSPYSRITGFVEVFKSFDKNHNHNILSRIEHSNEVDEYTNTFDEDGDIISSTIINSGKDNTPKYSYYYY